MKKNILLVLCIALLPAAAWAQEKTLYNINDDLLSLVELYAFCVEHESACTAADLQAIKADVKSCLQDLVGLLKSGDYSRMMLTLDQARELRMRARALQERLAHIEIADEACNAAIHFFTQFLVYSYDLVLLPIIAIVYIAYYGLIPFIYAAIVTLISVPWYLLMTLVLSPSCLLWWL